MGAAGGSRQVKGRKKRDQWDGLKAFLVSVTELGRKGEDVPEARGEGVWYRHIYTGSGHLMWRQKDFGLVSTQKVHWSLGLRKLMIQRPRCH